MSVEKIDRKIFEIFQTAIELEEAGVKFYANLKDAVEDSKGKSLLSYLANEEKDHIATLKEEFAVLSKKVDTKIAKSTCPAKIFLALKIDKNKLSKMKPEDAIKLAIKAEKDSIEFYTKGQKFFEDEHLKKVFKKLVEFEENHVRNLKSNYECMMMSGCWEGYVPILEG